MQQSRNNVKSPFSILRGLQRSLIIVLLTILAITAISLTKDTGKKFLSGAAVAQAKSIKPYGAPKGADKDDVKALRKLIIQMNQRGGKMDTDMSGDHGCYTWKNGRLYSIDLAKKKLKGHLKLPRFTKLTIFSCRSNNLTQLNVSACRNLKGLDCKRNKLLRLDISGCKNLTTLSCFKNKLTKLDVSGCTELVYLECCYNRLTQLNVSGCTKLDYLGCSGNRLTVLDLSNTGKPKQNFHVDENVTVIYPVQ